MIVVMYPISVVSTGTTTLRIGANADTNAPCSPRRAVCIALILLLKSLSYLA